MADEIQDIITQVVALQKAISPPIQEKALADAFDEAPEQIAAFPVFVNVFREIRDIERAGGIRKKATLEIEMMLLFPRSASKYSDRSRRKWILPVMDKFDQNQGLNDTVYFSRITRIRGDDPEEFSDSSYIAVRFTLEAIMRASTVSLAV